MEEKKYNQHGGVEPFTNHNGFPMVPVGNSIH